MYVVTRGPWHTVGSQENLAAQRVSLFLAKKEKLYIRRCVLIVWLSFLSLGIISHFLLNASPRLPPWALAGIHYS